MANYALPQSHKDLMEKSLVETDNEVAQIMVRRLLLLLTTCNGFHANTL